MLPFYGARMRAHPLPPKYARSSKQMTYRARSCKHVGYLQNIPSIAVRRGGGCGRGCCVEEMFCEGPCIYCSRGVKGLVFREVRGVTGGDCTAYPRGESLTFLIRGRGLSRPEETQG